MVNSPDAYCCSRKGILNEFKLDGNSKEILRLKKQIKLQEMSQNIITVFVTSGSRTHQSHYFETSKF